MDGCLQNVHFVDSFSEVAHATAAGSPTPRCLVLKSPNRSPDVYAMTDSPSSPTSQQPPPSISIVDPITGNRIFVPPFTTTAATVSNLVSSFTSPGSPLDSASSPKGTAASAIGKDFLEKGQSETPLPAPDMCNSENPA
uniref:Uncharacterized protein n=2 Tax=Mesocestoides corti TaxID=53468 RepID=A0A5K3FPQ7_MESCO